MQIVKLLITVILNFLICFIFGYILSVFLLLTRIYFDFGDVTIYELLTGPYSYIYDGTIPGVLFVCIQSTVLRIVLYAQHIGRNKFIPWHITWIIMAAVIGFFVGWFFVGIGV